MLCRPYVADDLLNIPRYPDLIPMGSNSNDFADNSLFSPIFFSLNKNNHNGSRWDPNVVNESSGYKQWVPVGPKRCSRTRLI